MVRHSPPAGFDIQPVASTPARWIVLQGIETRCAIHQRSHDFVAPISNAQLIDAAECRPWILGTEELDAAVLGAYDSLIEAATPREWLRAPSSAICRSWKCQPPTSPLATTLQ